MTTRPFINHNIHELTEQFDKKKTDIDFLLSLLHELQCRDIPHASGLLEQILSEIEWAEASPKSNISNAVLLNKTQGVDLLNQGQKPSISNDDVKRANDRQDSHLASSLVFPQRLYSLKKSSVPKEDTDLLSLTEPERVIRAWAALEILSPQSFLRPEDLAGGSHNRIALFDPLLPWKRDEKQNPEQKLYYQIVLGTVKIRPAVSQLLNVYEDKRTERPSIRGESILATFIVDHKGRLIDPRSFVISSFAWGIPIAMAGNLKDLDRWQSAETTLTRGLYEFIVSIKQRQLTKELYKSMGDVEQRPLTRGDIHEAYFWLLRNLGLPEKLTLPPRFAVKSYQPIKSEELPEPLLFNSFFLKDLETARQLFKTNAATANLKRYMGQMPPSCRQDLIHSQNAIVEALHPSKMPFGRWPAKGRHPLVALQQAAVNLATHDLKKDGILAVNGPPGTGKTTLLRDIVAHIITERAGVMATFDDPESAFIDTGLKVQKNNAFLTLYKLDERLRGFEIIVASSNNKAVENVSAELPAQDAVAEDAFHDGYFKSISDALLDRETWGLIAAILGNSANCAKFRQKFWWDSDKGMLSYLQNAGGKATASTVIDGKQFERPPLVVSKENPPCGKKDALNRWKKARDDFREAHTRAQKLLKDAEHAADLSKKLNEINGPIEKLHIELNSLTQSQQEITLTIEKEERQLQLATEEHEHCLKDIEGINVLKPSWIARFLQLQSFREWSQEFRLFFERATQAKNAKNASKQKILDAQNALEHLQDSIVKVNMHLSPLTREADQYKAERDHIESLLGGMQINEDYFSLSHEERQLASPWFGKEASQIRDDLFESAMKLHRAFIDAAAKPLRHNLNILMGSFGSQSLETREKDEVIPHLWSSLFLTVPVVSTTFASVGKLFSKIPPDEFGWLLIDEAGQALPQAAVGAVMRCKRAVVVGDPLQIEPVVILPDQLIGAICKEFGVDKMRFNGPTASAQTLADRATSYFSSFETKRGLREVGVPLLVHRRCADPMFSISNAVAYENLMVQAKKAKFSPIAEVLGPSTWHHVEGNGQGKWCEAEGDLVLYMLKTLKNSGVQPDLYIVTPFTLVKDQLREKVRRNRILENWVKNPMQWISERIGTVHTVQGRESEAVIFVLGAPFEDEAGARNWAGSSPNLLNVAVSRAQEALYVIGNRDLWQSAGVFSELKGRI